MIPKLITSITDKKIRENFIREKTLNLKTTMDLVTQDSYEWPWVWTKTKSNTWGIYQQMLNTTAKLQITNIYHTKKWYYTTIGCKLVKTTANNHQQNSIGRIPQSIKGHRHKILQAIRNEPYNQKRWSEDPNKTRMLPHPIESQTNTISPTEGREKRSRPINKIRTFRKTENTRRRLFCITRSNDGKERQNGKNCTRHP